MNSVRPLTALIQKRTEGEQIFRFVCFQDDVKVIPDSRYSYKAYFSTIESLVKTVDMKINGDILEFSSKQILDLSAGIYKLEIWEIVDDKVHGIYPSSNVKKMKFTVVENALDLPQGTVSSLTLDEFKRELEQYVPHDGGTGGVSGSIDVQKRIVTINGKSIKIPSEVDLTGLASKNDLQDLVKQTDLVNYAKRDELPKVSLNIAQRTIEVNGVKLNIPPVIDTSSFALKAEVPTVSLDLSSRIIYIGTQSIKIPNEVYLSEYYTKAQVDAAFNNHKIDLTGYLTIADADSKYVANERFNSTIDKLQKQITTSGGTSMGEGDTLPKSIRPSSLRTVWGEHTYLLFDNGAKFHLGENENNRSKLWGNFYDNGDPSKVDFTWNSPYGMTGFQAQPVGSFLTAYMHGIIRLSDLGKKGTGEYWSYHNSYVENPVQDANDYIWDAAHVSSDKVAGEPELSFIKCLYGIGMLSDEEAISIGAVKR